MDQKRDELLFSQRQGQEPVQGQARAPGVLPGDRRSRRSRRRVMRGAATPTGADGRRRGVSGFQRRHEQAPAVRPRGARRSCWPKPAIRTASKSAMNCPNDRYVNDAAICQAVAANLARIGVKINLHGRDQGHATSRRSCAATRASTCSAGRRAPSTRTTCCTRIMATPGRQGRRASSTSARTATRSSTS